MMYLERLATVLVLVLMTALMSAAAMEVARVDGGGRSNVSRIANANAPHVVQAHAYR
jgi:hypothetical protein